MSVCCRVPPDFLAALADQDPLDHRYVHHAKLNHHSQYMYVVIIIIGGSIRINDLLLLLGHKSPPKVDSQHTAPINVINGPPKFCQSFAARWLGG